ncbi:unnamed protein product [Protopolystoma xenopodis]|uniref:Uncharacterized protein n=1 Tax=Protopolystoma xenopodis TaxID=117903 RepID=A0A3S5BW06_9PLAT|nr:unnamed protein product [Protopolystoma xenopodis]
MVQQSFGTPHTSTRPECPPSKSQLPSPVIPASRRTATSTWPSGITDILMYYERGQMWRRWPHLLGNPDMLISLFSHLHRSDMTRLPPAFRPSSYQLFYSPVEQCFKISVESSGASSKAEFTHSRNQTVGLMKLHNYS